MFVPTALVVLHFEHDRTAPPGHAAPRTVTRKGSLTSWETP